MPRKKAANKPKNPRQGNNGGGRKKKWDELDMPNKLELVEGWARNGMTDVDMMAALGVANETFYKWKREYPEFVTALSKGKEIADIQVESAMFRRALGYSADEITQEMSIVIEDGRVQTDADGNPIKRLQVTKVVTKQVAPDVTAQIFWLKNRQPGRWRDKQEIKHTGGPVHFVNDLPPDIEDDVRAD